MGALITALDTRGSGVDQQGPRGEHRGPEPGERDGTQGGNPVHVHLFLHADSALAAAMTRLMPEAMRQGMIHQAS